MEAKTFEASEDNYDPEWVGTYVVRVVMASEYIEIEDAIVRFSKEQKLDPDQQTPEKRAYYTGLCFLKGITRNGEPFTKQPLELINTMPSKLYSILNAMYNNLNALSKDERDFLSKL